MASMDNEAVYHAAERIYDKKFSERLEREGFDLPYTRKESSESFARSFVEERKLNPDMSFGDLYRKAAEDVKNRFEYHYTTFEYECNIASLKDHEREIASDATLDMRGLERMARKYTKYMPEHSSDMNDKEHFKMVFDAFKDFCEQEHVAEPYKLMASMLSSCRHSGISTPCGHSFTQ